MKYLLIGLVFLLLGNQTLLAQETIPDTEDIENLPDFFVTSKPVICGPKRAVFDKIVEFNEVPYAAWIDAGRGNNVMLYINVNTGTTTVVEQMGGIACIINQGKGGAVVSPPEKIKGMRIKYLTF